MCACVYCGSGCCCCWLLSLVVAFTFATLSPHFVLLTRSLRCRLCAVCQPLRRVSYNLYSPLGARISRRAAVVVVVAHCSRRRPAPPTVCARSALRFFFAIFRVQFCILQCSSAAGGAQCKIENKIKEENKNMKNRNRIC